MTEKTPEEIGREVAGDDEQTAALIALAIQTDRDQRNVMITVRWTTTVTETYEAELSKREFYDAITDGTADSYLGDCEGEHSKRNVEVTDRVATVDGKEVWS